MRSSRGAPRVPDRPSEPARRPRPRPYPDPYSFTEEDWARQGHEVRSILDYAWVNGQLYLRVCWEDSWEPAENLARLDELHRLQQRIATEGDSTDLVSLA